MKCHTCGYEGRFASLRWISSAQYDCSCISELPDPESGTGRESLHLGSVRVFACPNCGTVRTDLKGHVALDKNREEGR